MFCAKATIYIKVEATYLILLERFNKCMDRILCALDCSCQKQNYLNYFFILRNPIVEWFSLVFRDILLISVLNFLCALQNVTGSSVDSSLNVFEWRLENTLPVFEEHVIIKECFELHLWLISSSSDSFLHSVERVHRRMKQRLIHWPVVVFWKFLNFFCWNRFDVLIKEIWAYCLDQIFNYTFDFNVFAFEF